MFRIALIIPFLGKFQNYYKFWIQSCINNSSVDFFIFTDDIDFIDYVNKSKSEGCM